MIQYLYLIGLIYLFVCPFTKVEESFNLQAMHDIIFHKWNFSEFDHFEFPGVVPRTFLGPLTITLLVSPIVTIIDVLGLISSNKFICQYIVRAAISCCVLYSFQKLHKSVKSVFGDSVGLWFLLLTASQYHFMYYLSRPLPNIMVLPLVLLAVNSWLKQDHVGLVCFSAAAVVIFRFELAIFLGLIIIIEVLKGHTTFLRVMKIGILASLCALMVTVAVDSFFWQRLIWPEGEVFWFNIVLNKSSDWGVSPFFWYWYSALPRALGASITLVPFGVRKTKLLITPAILFILIFSFLPHKELRFIIYTFPLFNIAVATACNKIWINRHKSMSHWIVSVYTILHLIANVCLSCVLLKVASENYPGGQAITQLHRLVPPNTEAHVYIDNLSAQTGVSRFTQVKANWIYNKTENLPTGSKDYFIFSHLLLEAKSKYSPTLKPFINSHEILAVIEGFSHINFNYNSFPPVKIKCKPMIFILKRNIIPRSILRDKNISQTLETPLNLDEFKKIDVEIVNEIIIQDNNSDFSKEVKSELEEDKMELKLGKVESQPQEISDSLLRMNLDDLFGDKFVEDSLNEKLSSKDSEKSSSLKQKNIKFL